MSVISSDGHGATMAGMVPETRTWKRWLTGDGGWFTLAASGAAAVAAFGFVLSFNRLGSGAQYDGLHPWWLLPLSIDAPILVFVVADHYLVSRGYRSVFARGCAWGFAVLTVALNVAAPSAPLWHWARVAAPAAWILGIEAVRRMWKAHRLGARPAADRAPVTEWVGSPRRTLGMWRRKLALGVTGWKDMRHLEEARLLVADLASARSDSGQPVAAAVARTVRTGWFPAALAEAVTGTPAAEWEPLVTGWAARQMALPETLLAAITDASPAPSPAPSPEPVVTPSPEVPVTPRTSTPRAPSRNPRQLPGRDLSPEALADLARAELPAIPVPSVNGLMALAKDKGMPVGRPKAQAAHKILSPRRRAAAK